MLRLPGRLACIGLSIVGLFALSAGLVLAASPSVTFDTTIGPPPATAAFDIGFVNNETGDYVLADRTNNAVDWFNAKALTFTGAIGGGGFVGNPATCPVPRACGGPNGDLIDNNGHVWAGDGPASSCGSDACRCFAGETTSMVKEYTLAVSSGTTGRLACLDTGGKFRADEMAFDPRDNLLLVANDIDGFLTLISTSGTPRIVDQFFYSDNDVGKPASSGGLATPGGGIEQPVWNPQQGFFYLALPQGTTVGRVDVFNPKAGKLVFVRSLDVAGCTGGPSGLAINTSDELLGECSGSGAALINARNGKTSIIGTAESLGGADEIWFDPGSNAWYVSTPGKLGVVSGVDHSVQDKVQPGCCGHSVAAYTASSSQSFIFDPNAVGNGISVFKAVP